MKRTIYNSEVDYEDAKKSLLLNHEDESDYNPTDEEVYNEMAFISEMDFDDALNNLHMRLDEDILCIASLGLWSGRKTGYKVLDNNLNSILKCACGDYYEVFYDGFNVCAKDSHHDGTNYYTFRKIKPNVNIDVLLDKLYSGTATNADINRYTISLRRYVKEIYGW